MMSTALAPHAPSLFELEQSLEALLDTESFVSEEQEAEFREELASSLSASVEKRDRCGQFIRHCQLQQDNCDAEIDRLMARRKSFASAEERMRKYLQAVIESLGPDAKGKPKRLEGQTVTFSLRAKQGAVDISDEDLVPASYKNATVKMPANVWEHLLSQLPDDAREMLLDHANLDQGLTVRLDVRKSMVKEAIDLGIEVPGADISIGGYSLVVR